MGKQRTFLPGILVPMVGPLMTYLDKRLHVEQWVPDHSLAALGKEPQWLGVFPGAQPHGCTTGLGCVLGCQCVDELGLHHADTLPQLFLGLLPPHNYLVTEPEELMLNCGDGADSGESLGL